MKTCPCAQCALLMRNKNNPVCRNCADRVQYVSFLERLLGDAGASYMAEKPTLLPPIQRIRRQFQ